MVPTAQPVTARQERVSSAIRTAASRTGVDFSYLYHQARIESGLNPDARARTSSATGLFQFIDQSWLGVVRQHGAQHGLGWAANAISRGPGGRYTVSDPAMRRAIMDLRREPGAASAMAAEFAADNRDYLSSRLGRAPESVDLYLAHFLGPAGAARFLSAHAANPDAAAAPAFGAQARANRSIFFTPSGAARSYDEIRQLFAAKLGDGAGAAGAVGDDAGATRGTTFVPGARWHQAIVPAFEQALSLESGAAGGQDADAAAMPQRFAGEVPQAWGDDAFLRDIALRPSPEQARLAYLLLARLGA